jgi:hypothetical protein
MDTNFEIKTEIYEGVASFSMPIRVNSEVQPGSQSLQVEVQYQACSDNLCQPPRTLILRAPLRIIAAAPVTAGSDAVAAGAVSELSPQGNHTYQVTTATMAPSVIPASTIGLNGGETRGADKPSVSNQEQSIQPSNRNAQLDRLNTAIPPGEPIEDVTLAGDVKSDGTLWSSTWLAVCLGALALLIATKTRRYKSDRRT